MAQLSLNSLEPELAGLAPSEQLRRIFIDQAWDCIEFVPINGPAFTSEAAATDFEATNQEFKAADTALRNIKRAAKVLLLVREGRALITQIDEAIKVEHDPQTASYPFTFKEYPLPSSMSK